MSNAVILTYDISTIFEPSQYLEHGFEKPITLREKLVFPSAAKTTWHQNFVALDTIYFYDSKFLDMSSYEAIETYQLFTNYHVSDSYQFDSEHKKGVPHVVIEYRQSRE